MGDNSVWSEQMPYDKNGKYFERHYTDTAAKLRLTLKEMADPKIVGRSRLQRRQWLVKRGRQWFTVSVERGDKLNG